MGRLYDEQLGQIEEGYLEKGYLSVGHVRKKKGERGN